MLPPIRRDAIAGLLLGLAVGDAIGLPREGLSPRRAARLFKGGVRHSLIFGRGMVSDDTDHACMTAQAFLSVGPDADPERFSRDLAWRLRLWLLSAPVGIGRATLLATLRLWAGVPPGRSGIASAGNGPAMRAPVLGLLARDSSQLRSLVRVSTRLTHSDARAEHGALVIALAARHAAAADPDVVPPTLMSLLLRDLPADSPLVPGIRAAVAGAGPHAALREVGADPCRGASGYIVHTVPAALACWLAYPGDFRAAIEAALRLGGDTDTVAAITGALAGAHLGPAAIPRDWVSRLTDAPRSTAHLAILADALADAIAGTPRAPVPLFWPAYAVRSPLMVAAVLSHAFRRLLPPY